MLAQVKLLANEAGNPVREDWNPLDLSMGRMSITVTLYFCAFVSSRLRLASNNLLVVETSGCCFFEVLSCFLVDVASCLFDCARLMDELAFRTSLAEILGLTFNMQFRRSARWARRVLRGVPSIAVAVSLARAALRKPSWAASH